jgi:hypothetical protein
MSAAARDYLVEHGFRYVGGCSLNSSTELQRKVRFDVAKPGDWAGLWNSTTNELNVLYYDKNNNLGKKQVYSNAFCLHKGYLPIKELIPAYDLYRVVFAACDRFSKDLNGKIWPFKHGGYKKLGDVCAEDNFAFTCTLINTYNAYRSMDSNEKYYDNFTEFCFDLSDQLYLWASKNV